jgi:hypothetical protein
VLNGHSFEIQKTSIFFTFFSKWPSILSRANLKKVFLVYHTENLWQLCMYSIKDQKTNKKRKKKHTKTSKNGNKSRIKYCQHNLLNFEIDFFLRFPVFKSSGLKLTIIEIIRINFSRIDHHNTIISRFKSSTLQKCQFKNGSI